MTIANILAIDCANEYLNLGISINKQIYQTSLKSGNTHSEYIIPEIDKLIHSAGITLANLDVIAYNHGPGAFTGLRIGLGCALGLAYTLQVKLAAIPAFLLYLATKSQNRHYLGVCLDARLNQIYFAIVNVHDYSYILAPCLAAPQEIARIINDIPELTADNLQLTGNGITTYQAQIDPALLNKYQYLQQEYPGIERMLHLCQHGHYRLYSPNDADLLYIRNKVALNLEEQRLNKLKP